MVLLLTLMSFLEIWKLKVGKDISDQRADTIWVECKSSQSKSYIMHIGSQNSYNADFFLQGGSFVVVISE